MCLVVALDRGFIGVAAVNCDRLRQPVAADRLLEKAQRRLFVPMLGEQKVNGLALLIYRTLEIAPLALHLNVCLVHPPAHPHGTLVTLEGFLALQEGTCDKTPFALPAGEIFPFLLLTLAFVR